MSPATLAFCIALPVLSGAFAIVTHLVECHRERLQQTHFCAPRDYERYHYARLNQFLNGDQR